MALSAPRSRAFGIGRVSNRPLLIGLAADVGIGGVYLATQGNPLTRNRSSVTYHTARVSQGTLQLTINATGPVTDPASVPLSFKSSGKLSEVEVSMGLQVTAGQVLAKLDTSDLRAAVDQAQADLDQQQANLAKLTSGPTPQQAALAQAQTDAAQSSLAGDQKSLQASQGSADTNVAASQPNSAMAGDGSVRVMRNGAPARVQIQTCSSGGTTTVVLSGLQPGERVVTGTTTGGSGRSASNSGSGSIFGFGPGGGNRPAGQNGQGQGGGQQQQQRPAGPGGPPSGGQGGPGGPGGPG